MISVVEVVDFGIPRCVCNFFLDVFGGVNMTLYASTFVLPLNLALFSH